MRNQISRRLSLVFFFFSIILFFSTCKKVDVDTQAPSITVLQPTDSASFSRGNDFLGVTIMKDFVSLHSYRFTISWHDDPLNIPENPNDSTWELDETKAIDGDDNSQNVSWYINVPADIKTGYYELDIYCYDDENNVRENNRLILITN